MSTPIIVLLWGVLLFCTYISLVRINHFSGVINAIYANAVPDYVTLMILDFYKVQQLGLMWRVWAMWLIGPAIGVVVGLFLNGYIATGLAVVCFIPCWKSIRLSYALETYRLRLIKEGHL